MSDSMKEIKKCSCGRKPRIRLGFPTYIGIGCIKCGFSVACCAETREEALEKAIDVWNAWTEKSLTRGEENNE